MPVTKAKAPLPYIPENYAFPGRLSIKVKLPLCLTDYALRHEGVWGSGCIDPRLLDLGNRGR
jgi:hypothetical protein